MAQGQVFGSARTWGVWAQLKGGEAPDLLLLSGRRRGVRKNCSPTAACPTSGVTAKGLRALFVLRPIWAVTPRPTLRRQDRRATGGPPTAPHYGPIQRMRILKLKAARGWSSSQVAQVFAITEETIASWLKRVDEAVAAGSTFLVIGRPIHAALGPQAAALSIGASF